MWMTWKPILSITNIKPTGNILFIFWKTCQNAESNQNSEKIEIEGKTRQNAESKQNSGKIENEGETRQKA